MGPRALVHAREPADDVGMMPIRSIGSSVLPFESSPRSPLARAQRLASLLALTVFVLGTLVSGDAAARAVKERVKHAKRESGVASYYGREFAWRKTANGERFDPREMTAAHRTLPFGTKIRVTNLANGRRVVLRVNDRGPYRKGRVLDVSHAAARKLGFAKLGTARVRIDILSRPRPERVAERRRSEKSPSRRG